MPDKLIDPNTSPRDDAAIQQAAEKLMSEADTADFAKLLQEHFAQNMSQTYQTCLVEIMFNAIAKQRLDIVKSILALPTLPENFVNTEEVFGFSSTHSRVSFLRYAMVVNVEPKSVSTKIAIVDALLDAGANAIALEFSFDDMVDPAPEVLVCMPKLWPGITEEEHLRLLQRLRDLGARPHRQPEPMLQTAWEIATKEAPYLLPLLPDNEDDDGEISLFPIPQLRAERTKARAEKFEAAFPEQMAAY